MLSNKFISATKEYCTFEKHVAAPYMRKSFFVPKMQKTAKLTICGLGFYRLFFNGEEITASYMAPYISNPDHSIYYNVYDLTDMVRKGKNTLAFLLGNGFLNNMGGFVWKMDEASFRSAPKVAFALELDDLLIEADESVRVHPSPITFDDLRAGERYDARLEIPDWTKVEYNDDNWMRGILAETPKGEKRIFQAEPIVVEKEIAPKAIIKGDGGFIYDFGINTSGIALLQIRGKAGQTVKLLFSEVVNDGKADLRNISFEGFTKEDYNQCVIYTCKEGHNLYTPSFCYMGYRYIFVTGITEEQATQDLLTMLKMHSDISPVCDFACLDPVINQLYANTMNSDVSNFYYFPTDCPQREKNGWTGDMTLSAEQMLLNFDCERGLREWMFNLRKAQLENGKLPCITPTTPKWGYDWGPGPAWDAALVEMPYRIYQFTGKKEAIYENGEAIYKYLQYMESKRDTRGLLAYGLGDWCQVNLDAVEQYTTPLYVTDTLICAEMCRKAATLYGAVGEQARQAYCQTLYVQLMAAFREYCVDEDCRVAGNTQTGQAMALYYGVFTDKEQNKAIKHLLALIHDNDDHFDVGVMGSRVLFRVLSDFGECDLAHKLIAQPSFPSFGYHISLGATSLFESFYRLNERFEIADGRWLDILSQNHHFWGDIAAFFVEYFAGLRINPDVTDIYRVDVTPCIPSGMTWAKCSRKMEYGMIRVEWKIENGVWSLLVDTPAKTCGTVSLPNGEKHALVPGVTQYTLQMSSVAVKTA